MLTNTELQIKDRDEGIFRATSLFLLQKKCVVFKKKWVAADRGSVTVAFKARSFQNHHLNFSHSDEDGDCFQMDKSSRFSLFPQESALEFLSLRILITTSRIRG